MFVALGNFNVKTTYWFKGDSNSYDCLNTDTSASQFCFEKLINVTTHLTASSSPCIDLIFTYQSDLVIVSGIHSSLHPDCRHQIVFADFILSICYPSPYVRKIWHYEKAIFLFYFFFSQVAALQE